MRFFAQPYPGYVASDRRRARYRRHLPAYLRSAIAAFAIRHDF